jgi:digeranylgeranylglycerophospholipid reductase
MNIEYDAVVVGAGPIGCRVAAGLALAGHAVMILEKKPTLDLPICCTSLISEECLRCFNLDSNLVIKSFQSAILFSPALREIHLRREQVQAHLLNRPELDKSLLQKAISSGSKVLFDSNVTGIMPGDNHVDVSMEYNLVPEIIRTRVVIIASGFGLSFTRGIGVVRNRTSAIGIQTKVMAELEDIEIYLNKDFAPGFFAWVVPISESEAFAGLISSEYPKRRFEIFLDRLLAAGKIKKPISPTARGITINEPNVTYGNRFLLVGDCAGQTKPLTGGGIYYGLLSADIAVDVLKDALQNNDLSDKALSVYERNWHRLLGREITAAKYTRKIFSILNNKQIDIIVNLAKKYNIDRRLSESKVGFDWHGAAIKRAVFCMGPLGPKEKRWIKV